MSNRASVIAEALGITKLDQAEAGHLAFKLGQSIAEGADYLSLGAAFRNAVISDASLAVSCGEVDDRETWLEDGRTPHRVLLWATASNPFEGAPVNYELLEAVWLLGTYKWQLQKIGGAAGDVDIESLFKALADGGELSELIPFIPSVQAAA